MNRTQGQISPVNVGKRGDWTGLAQVALGLAGELGHDLRPVDQEEERARLVGHGTCEQRLQECAYKALNNKEC